MISDCHKLVVLQVLEGGMQNLRDKDAYRIRSNNLKIIGKDYPIRVSSHWVFVKSKAIATKFLSDFG